MYKRRDFAFSRPALPEFCDSDVPRKDRGRRECQVLGRTRSLMCKWEAHMSVVTTG
jgi:hypothetical protein